MSKDFKKHGNHKLSRLSNSWRKPRGLHNKLRLGFKDYGRNVSIGHGTATNVEQIVVVKCEGDIKNLKGKQNIKILFSSKLGQLKKLKLLKLAQESGLAIANVDDKYAENVEKKQKEKKQLKEEKEQKKEKKQKELDKKAKDKKAEKKEEEAELSDDEKKEAEKKERDKILTKKDGM